MHPAHISAAWDNCAISQRVAETLFTARCGGVGGGYELMSSERKTTGSPSNIHSNTQMHLERRRSPIRSGAFLAGRGYFSYRDPPRVQQKLGIARGVGSQ